MLDRLEDVFESLRKNEVRALVIGGIAAVLHGVPRATFDLDLLIDATTDNARRLLDALSQAGLGTATLTNPEELLANEITVFKDVVRIDVFTHAPGIDFASAWTRRENMRYRGREFAVVSRADLIAAKRAAGREMDLQDLKVLERAGDG